MYLDMYYDKSRQVEEICNVSHKVTLFLLHMWYKVFAV